MTLQGLAVQRNHRPLRYSLALGWLCTALGCSESVSDETRLTALRPEERRALCEEIVEALPGPEQAFTCADGQRVSFESPEPSSCATVEMVAEQEPGCAASAGDVRACVAALVADPCQAASDPPLACRQLEASGCGAYTAVPSARCAALSPAQIAAFEGVYELVGHTRNERSCDSAGSSILTQDAERLLMLVGGELLGTPLAALRSCTDLADCQGEIAAIREASRQPLFTPVDPTAPGPELSSLFLCPDADGSALRGRGSSAGTLPEGQCALSSVDQVLRRGSDGLLRYERRTFAWTERDEGSGCGTGALPQAGVPCSELEVLEARWVSAL